MSCIWVSPRHHPYLDPLSMPHIGIRSAQVLQRPEQVSPPPPAGAWLLGAWLLGKAVGERGGVPSGKPGVSTPG